MSSEDIESKIRRALLQDRIEVRQRKDKAARYVNKVIITAGVIIFAGLVVPNVFFKVRDFELNVLFFIALVTINAGNVYIQKIYREVKNDDIDAASKIINIPFFSLHVFLAFQIGAWIWLNYQFNVKEYHSDSIVYTFFYLSFLHILFSFYSIYSTSIVKDRLSQYHIHSRDITAMYTCKNYWMFLTLSWNVIFILIFTQ